MNRIKYLVYRSVQTVFILWLVLTFLFFLFRLMPGSFIDLMAGAGATPETIAALEEKWGLNEPLYQQYFDYLSNFVVLDVGTSLAYRVPVWDFVKLRIFNTFILVAPAVTISYIIGIILGTYLGTNRGSRSERYGIIPIVTAGTMPEFFTSILLVMVFASGIILNWFPTGGMLPTETVVMYRDASWWRPYLTTDFIWHYTLPFIAILLRFIYIPTLIMRTSVVEVAGLNHTYYHKITGLPKLKIYKHIAKHSILPVITLYPVSMTRALGGLVLIEMVFNWPGIGFTLVEAVLSRDYPVVQFVFFVVAAFVIISNFVVDILYGYIDPRISVGEDS